MNPNHVNLDIEIGARVEEHQTGHVGYVVDFGYTHALVRFPKGERRIHRLKLTRLPSEAEIEASKAAIRSAAGIPNGPVDLD